MGKLRLPSYYSHFACLIDDVPTNAQVLRAALEPFGHRVVDARSMRHALDLAAREMPDLVISDVHVAEGSGYDLVKAFKADKRLAPVPFIFLSSTYWHGLDRARGIALGADKFLVRPIDPQELLDEVNATLSARDR